MFPSINYVKEGWKKSHPVDANPVTPRVALGSFPPNINRFAKVEPRIAGFTWRNRDLVFGGVIRRQVICNAPRASKVQTIDIRSGYR